MDILINVLFLRALIDALVRKAPFVDIIQLSTLAVSVTIITYVFNLYLKDYYYPYMMNQVHKTVQSELIQKASEVDLKNYDNTEFYDKYVWLMNDADFRALETLRSLTDFLRSSLSLILLFSIFIFIDPVMLLFSLTPLILSLVLNTRMSKIRYQMDKQKIPYERKRDYIKRVFYLQQYAKEVRLTHIAQVLITQFYSNINTVISIVKGHTKRLAFLDILSSITQMILGTIGSMLYLSYQVFRGVLSLGDFSALLSGAGQMNQSLQGMFASFSGIYQNSLYIENFRVFMDYQAETKARDPLEPMEITDAVYVRHVTFAYPGKHYPVLNSVHIRIAKGEKIAIVGHNGAGKSTLIKLLLGLYTPDQGEIMVYGKRVDDYEKLDYQAHFQSVLQEFQIYATSIAENVLMRPVEDVEVDEAMVWQALEKVGMKERIRRLPEGIYTDCSREFNEEGIELSGGEKQRLAVARIFASPCDILILDEPTSALDPLAEDEIFQIIMDNCSNKSVVFISHRLSITRQSDRIYYLEQGEILEEGTHDELMKLNGGYCKMFSVQAKKYGLANQLEGRQEGEADMSNFT